MQTEPLYKALYREVLTFADWAAKRGLDKRDVGIDLVAETGTGEVHAVQCKLYAPDYVVNGKSAIEWVMERQSVTTDKDSGIVKDANAWATETMGEARYPLSLLLRVITVSLETEKVVRSLPALHIMEERRALGR